MSIGLCRSLGEAAQRSSSLLTVGLSAPGVRTGSETSRRRREVIVTLERIAFYSDLFLRSASLLLALAESENEHWANNADWRIEKALLVFNRSICTDFGALARCKSTC